MYNMRNVIWVYLCEAESSYGNIIGLRSRYGKPLSPDSINRLLTSPTYAGYVADSFTNYELVEGKHPRIISPEVYELNQKLLQGGRRTGEVRLKFNPEYPLKGLILCPNCHKALYASAPKTGAGGKSPRYHCSRRACKGTKSIKADVLHKAFMKMLEKITPSNEVMELYREVLVREAINRSGNVNHEIKNINDKLEDIADRRLRVIRMLTEGALTVDEKNEQTDMLDSQKEAYTAERGRLVNKQGIQEADIDRIVNMMGSIPAQWLDSDLATQQRFQNLLFPKGLVYDYENELFGTSQLSDLYRYTLTKKDSELPSKSFLVDVIGRYSKPRFPEKTLEELTRIFESTHRETKTPGSKVQVLPRDIRRRLGQAKIDDLVARYRSGVPTTQLMKDFDLSKTAVLKLLKEAGITMRRQPLTEEQVREAVMLYGSGLPISKTAECLNASYEATRLALIAFGVRMRLRGGSDASSS